MAGFQDTIIHLSSRFKKSMDPIYESDPCLLAMI